MSQAQRLLCFVHDSPLQLVPMMYDFFAYPFRLSVLHRHSWAVVLAISVLAGCAFGPPAPHDERHVGEPLPYEPPAPGLQTAPPLPPISPRIVTRGPRQQKLIALTFDACSTRGVSHFDEAVIRELIRAEVPATLFLGGKWMEEHADETIELTRYPQFELANHTQLHPHLRRESDARVREELARTQDVLYTLTGRQARLFRAPYGELDERVAKLAGQAGLISVQYSLPSGDPDPAISAKRLIDYVSDMARSGSIVVMHMNGRGWHTAEALPRIIFRLRKKGFRFVTVGELIGLASTGPEVLPPPASPPKAGSP